jgi:hypothetical protein
MLLLNFSHPLTAVHLAQIEALTRQTVERVIDLKTHLDHERPFIPQSKDLVNRIDLSPSSGRPPHY